MGFSLHLVILNAIRPFSSIAVDVLERHNTS